MAWSERTRQSHSIQYLLLESGDFILQENNDKIVISYGDLEWGKRTRLTIDDWSKRTRPIT